MKKLLLFLLALTLIFSCTTFAATAEDTTTPKLTLQVMKSIGYTNIIYFATLNPISPTETPIITFFCNGSVVGRVPVNINSGNAGAALLGLSQPPGNYQAIAAWLNTPNPIVSNSIDYTVNPTTP